MDIFLPVFCLKTYIKSLPLHWYWKQLFSWRSEICRSCTNTNDKKDKSDYRPTSVLSIILKEGIQFVKRVQIWSFFYPCFPTFGPIWLFILQISPFSLNPGKLCPEKLQNQSFSRIDMQKQMKNVSMGILIGIKRPDFSFGCDSRIKENKKSRKCLICHPNCY